MTSPSASTPCTRRHLLKTAGWTTVGFLILSSAKAQDAKSLHLKPGDFVRKMKERPGRLIDVRAIEESGGETLKGADMLTKVGNKEAPRILPGKMTAYDIAFKDFPKDKPLYIYCRSGVRTQTAIDLLKRSGFQEVYGLEGGILRWKQSGLATTYQPKDYWNYVYAGTDYVFGKTPNPFFQTTIHKHKPGRILLPADGEGRNGVYAAISGWHVDAFDFSIEGKKKALHLALQPQAKIAYRVADFAKPNLTGKYDAIALIHPEITAKVRQQGWSQMRKALKPGGVVMVEAFSVAHFRANSRFGPKFEEMHFTPDSMKAFASGLNIQMLEEVKVEMQEGMYTGPATLIRMVATA